MFELRGFSVGLAFCLSIGFLPAQDVMVSGKFQNDSIKIGQPVPYTLRATYPASETVVFPDSTFSFAPFEIQKKEFFQTKTIDGQSTDSVVYHLTTFEIDRVQRLKLPVFVVHPKDCTAVFSETDSVFLQELIAHVPDSVSAQELPLKTNTAYQKVSWLFNYPLALILFGVLIVVIALTWIIFGKRIRKFFKLRRLTKSHGQFLNKFSQAIDRLERDFSKRTAEDAMLVWKKYMEELIDQPFTKYTTKEIRRFVGGELTGTLHAVDRMIYSDLNGRELTSFDKLREHAENEFHRIKEEVQNG